VSVIYTRLRMGPLDPTPAGCERLAKALADAIIAGGWRSIEGKAYRMSALWALARARDYLDFRDLEKPIPWQVQVDRLHTALDFLVDHLAWSVHLDGK